VTRLRVEPFADDHLDEAGGLLAARHRRHGAAQPLLAPTDARAAVEAAWREESVTGAVAHRGGEIGGYVLGRVRENDVWGRHVWIGRAGQAASEPEVLRDLYAALAGDWADAGLKLHFALVPALPVDLEPWYRLSFGQMQVHAVRPAGAEVLAPPDGVSIRRGSIDDLETAALRLATLIWEHQARSPALTGLTPPLAESLRADWIETLEDPAAAFFVAERHDGVVGTSVLYPPDPELGVPADSVYLATLVVVPEERGSGAGSALTSHVLAWAKEEGYGSVVTDWRAPNLLASRHWEAWGFRPTFHRLHRVIGVG